MYIISSTMARITSCITSLCDSSVGLDESPTLPRGWTRVICSPASPRTSFVARGPAGCIGNITPPGRRGRLGELKVEADNYLKIGWIDMGRGSKKLFVFQLLPCVVNDTKWVNMRLDNRKIGEGWPCGSRSSVEEAVKCQTAGVPGKIQL